MVFGRHRGSGCSRSVGRVCLQDPIYYELVETIILERSATRAELGTVKLHRSLGFRPINCLYRYKTPFKFCTWMHVGDLERAKLAENESGQYVLLRVLWNL